uniref:LOW QUALITY PROTEIN: coiled-coil domain-containing protein 153 n=1 Tax=Gasterosteus aculeatus aculeatus TaxID=481459 RepID=UPI001A994866
TVQSDRIDLKRLMRHTEKKLLQESQDHRDVRSGTVPTGHVSTISLSFNKLEKTERERTHGEKDAAMADLQHRLDYMETDYEKIIHNLIRPYLYQLHSDNSSELKENLPVARRGREDKGTNLHPHYKERLSEIGLNARHI